MTSTPPRRRRQVDLLTQARTRIEERFGGRPELRIELLTLVASSLLKLQQNVLAAELLGTLVP